MSTVKQFNHEAVVSGPAQLLQAAPLLPRPVSCRRYSTRRSDRLRCAAASATRPPLVHSAPTTTHTTHHHSSQISEAHAILQVRAAASGSSTSSTSTTTSTQLHSPTMSPADPTATAALPTGGVAGVQEWRGLSEWRARGVDLGRGWGRKGPTADVHAPEADKWEGVPLAGSLVECALQVLHTASPTGKAALTHRAWLAYNQGSLPLMPPQPPQPPQSASSSSAGADAATMTSSSSLPSSAPLPSPSPPSSQSSWSSPSSSETAVQASGLARPAASGGFRPCAAVPTPPIRPARPAKPVLVVPKLVPSFERGESPMTSGAAHMLHNLAHIELNAVDLAWDTVARFADGPIGAALPDMFFEDFARVADDESRHLGWCLQRLEELGHAYGDMPAHNLLWEGAQASSDDLSARLAVVPMSQEARGLDAGQRLVSRLIGSQDKRSAAIVERISQEERAHVAVGIAWFKRVCLAMGVEVPDIFRAHVSELCPELLKGPFHHAARQEVGLARDMYDITAWPEAAAKAIMPPTQAAWLRGRGRQVRQLAMEGNSTLLPWQQQQSQQQEQQHCDAGSELPGSSSVLSQAGGVQEGAHGAATRPAAVHQRKGNQSGRQERPHVPDAGSLQVGSASCGDSMSYGDSQQGSGGGPATSGPGSDRRAHGGQDWSGHAGFGEGHVHINSPPIADHRSQVVHHSPPVICGLVPEGQGDQALRALQARLALMLEVDGLMA